MSGIEYNLAHVSGSCKLDGARDMENISDGSLNAIFRKAWMVIGELIARPDHQIMRQLCQQDQHFLCSKTMFVAARQTQALFIAFVLGFETAAAQVIEMHSSEKDLFSG